MKQKTQALHKCEKNQSRGETNILGSCEEGPGTWSRCNLRAPSRRLSLLVSICSEPKHKHKPNLNPPISEKTHYSIWSITLRFFLFLSVFFWFVWLFVLVVLSNFFEFNLGIWPVGGQDRKTRGWTPLLQSMVDDLHLLVSVRQGMNDWLFGLVRPIGAL